MECTSLTNRLLYLFMIATISILSITVLIFDAEAKTSSESRTLKGFGADFTGPTVTVTAVPIENTKDVSIFYLVRTTSGVSVGVSCIGPQSVLHLSGLNKGSIEFNTADLVCQFKIGSDGVISATMQTNDLTTYNHNIDNTDCNKFDGVDFCTRSRGTTDGTSTNVKGTVFGVSFDDAFGNISHNNIVLTSWTNP